MPRTLKVWVGALRGPNGKWWRTIVAAHTKKRATELISRYFVSRFYFYEWWRETDNDVALSVPDGEGVWWSKKYFPEKASDFVPTASWRIL